MKKIFYKVHTKASTPTLVFKAMKEASRAATRDLLLYLAAVKKKKKSTPVALISHVTKGKNCVQPYGPQKSPVVSVGTKLKMAAILGMIESWSHNCRDLLLDTILNSCYKYTFVVHL